VCRDQKELDSVFVFHGPDHPNFQDQNRIGRLGDRQVEIPETSHRQDECAADFAPALGQVKDRSIANVLEAIYCCNAHLDLNRGPLSLSAVSGLDRGLGYQSFVCLSPFGHWVLLAAAC
jgi:hypothetical protein